MVSVEATNVSSDTIPSAEHHKRTKRKFITERKCFYYMPRNLREAAALRRYKDLQIELITLVKGNYHSMAKKAQSK